MTGEVFIMDSDDVGGRQRGEKELRKGGRKNIKKTIRGNREGKRHIEKY